MKARSLRTVSLLCISGAVALLCGFVMMLFLRPLSASSGSLGTEAINTAYGGSSLASCDPPPTIVVTSTEYYGPGTLRRALWLAQACYGTKIIFSPDVFPPSAATTIVITEAVQLKADGAIVDASNAGVILDGSQAGSSENGFELWSDECGVQGLTIRGFPGSGIYVVEGADGNTIGGSRAIGTGPNGEGNLIVLNGMDGIKIHGDGTLVQGNTIGIDPKDLEDWGNDASGISLTGGVTETIIGSTEVDRRNVISGNGRYGIQISGSGTPGNRVIGNYVGTGIDGVSSKGNGSAGILLGNGAQNNRIGDTTTGAGNTIAFNAEDGILAASCGGNSIARNSIHSNGGVGIRDVSHCLAAPVLTATDVGTDEAVTGSTLPGARVEIFADDADEGRFYEGSTIADDHGVFSFTKIGGFRASNVTATVTDAGGNTSAFSRPAHLAWTVLLYLNGDNDLQDAIFETFDNLAAAGPSPHANVLALVDGYTDTVRSGTVLYDMTWGGTVPMSSTVTAGGERDMGDGQTLVDFVTWSRAYAPARHTLLAIVDHGGGWAPTSVSVPGAVMYHGRDYLGGNSGMSWDFSSDFRNLDSRKMQRALATVTENGAAPLDVVFYDVCLMGMVEVAYQIQDYARFFVSSQNLGWTPVGADGRYVQAVREIGPTTTPRQMAELLVGAYARATPKEGHPSTVSAVDLGTLRGTVRALDDLGMAISRTLTVPGQASTLREAYIETQKLDYDADLWIEPEEDAFVDLYDFAGHAAQRFTDRDVIAAARALTTSLQSTIVAEWHTSGSPWLKPDRSWNLDNVHGLSVYLPLGEDRELRIPITQTSPTTPGLILTRNLHLREMYICDQLQFVCDTQWGSLITAYYDIMSSTLPTASAQGPLGGLLPSDVMPTPDVTPPQTIITATIDSAGGLMARIIWASVDSQAGVDNATLWHRPAGGQWTDTGLMQIGSAGEFSFKLANGCGEGLAVRAEDKAGNIEPIGDHNNIVLQLGLCMRLWLPLMMRNVTGMP